MPGPLSGIRVLDLTSVLLGPYATMILGDLGADVIKIEDPAGESTRYTGPARHPRMASFFLGANRNKRSLVLDLKKPAAQRALMRLVDAADVFVTNIRADAMQRLGFPPDAVLARNPRIVYAAIRGFGERGPYAERAAYDDIIQGACGIADLMGRVTGEPLYTPMVTGDKVCGLTSAYAIMAALVHRERSGRGQAVEIPMYETMVHFTLMEHQFGHTFDPPIGGMGYPRLLAPWRRPYPTRDGHICMLAYNDGQWRRFCEAVGRAELAADPRFADLAARTENVAEVYRQVGEIVKGRTTAEWLALLEAADIPHMKVNRLEDLPEDPHLKAVGFFRPFEHPTEGSLVMTDLPVRYGATPGDIVLPAPRLGEHSVDILREAGLSVAEIDGLVADGGTVDGRPGPTTT